MSELSIGVIGYGLRGGLSRHSHRPDEGSQVTALFDLDPAAHDRFREAYGSGVTTVSSLAEFLKLDLDAVFVLSPDWLHEEHAIAVLEAGAAVYLEKPMAITTEGCDRILQTAQRHGGKLYLGHNMRHMPFVRGMKRLIDDGAIGEPKVAWCRHFVGHGGDFYFRDWHAERDKGTSLLLQKGAHDIDVLHWLCDSYAETVSGIGDLMVYKQPTEARDDSVPWWQEEKSRLSAWPPSELGGLNPVIDVEDVSMINMRLGNGILASYQQCHFTPDYWRNYTVIGTEGRIENFGNGEPGTTIKLWNKRHNWQPEGDIEVPVDEETGGHGGADPRIVGEFLRYVREGGATDTSPVAARYAVAAGCAGAESLRNGSVPVAVPAAAADVVSYFD
jgi:predicted dehydrogenase